jgi:chromosome segregation ATPase
MVEYECNKCNKKYTKKADYIRHLNRKYPCDKKGFTCNRCNKIFNKTTDLTRHYNRKFPCDFSLKHESIQLKNENNTNMVVTDQLKELNEKYKNITLELEEIKKQINNNKITNTPINNTTNNTNNTTYNTTNNIINNIFIQITPFGKENLNFIKKEDCNKILHQRYQSPQALVEHVHFNKEKQEYHNIYIPNRRDRSHLLIYDGKTWNMTDKKNVLNDLKEKVMEFIQDKCKDLENNNIRNTK